VSDHRREIIGELIKIEEMASGGYERIPWRLCRTMVFYSELGLLSLMLGIANWGVDWAGYRTHQRQVKLRMPADPAGLQWAGPYKRTNTSAGKRFFDGPGPPTGGYGGLGILHCDSGYLRRIYAQFGRPPIPFAILNDKDFKYDYIRFKSKWWPAWREWAAEIVTDPGQRFHAWLVSDWLTRYWRESWEAWEGFRFEARVEAAALNVRINNSASHWDDHLRDRDPLPTLEEQAAYYVERKRKRSERAATRARKQVKMALRVGAVVRACRVAVD
jgi:hypothetical protein